MSKTAMQILLDEIDIVSQEIGESAYLKGLKLYIKEELIDKERFQILEAFKNASNNPGEAEKYYSITYNK